MNDSQTTSSESESESETNQASQYPNHELDLITSIDEVKEVLKILSRRVAVLEDALKDGNFEHGNTEKEEDEFEIEKISSVEGFKKFVLNIEEDEEYKRKVVSIF